jgi:hypothetical protein
VKYISVKEAAEQWGISIQMVRRYCKDSRIHGVTLRDGNWCIPEGAQKPLAKKELETEPPPKKAPLVNKMRYECSKNNHFGYYEYIQVNLAYSSSRMASNRLTREQVQEMYRTHRIGTAFEPMKIDDIVEINNHFVCVKNMVNYIMEPLSFELIRKVHYDLTYGTFADRQHKLGTGEFRVSAVKDYGANPNNIQSELETMIRHYEKSPADLSRILNLYVTFEKIRPFDDYNGRVGRVLMLKECLRHGITPFIIDDKHRSDHIRGIEKWSSNPKLLLSLCTRAQERFEVQSRFCKSMQYNRPPEAMC